LHRQNQSEGREQGETSSKVEESRRGSAQKFSVKENGVTPFGDVYTQFKGKPLEAANQLIAQKNGDAIGVFHRDGLGDIDLIWGDQGGGLEHIIHKHVGEGRAFATVEEAIVTIDNIIKKGTEKFANGDKVVLNIGDKIVTIRTNVRDKGKKIADKNWVLTAYDESVAEGANSAINTSIEGKAALTTSETESKVTDNSAKKQKRGGKKVSPKNTKFIADYMTSSAKESVDKTLVHEIQHAIQSREGFAKGGNKRMRIGESEERLGYEGYRKLAGEVEARNVSERMGKTMEERRASLRMETQDVADEDQIFIYDALESANTMFSFSKTPEEFDAVQREAVRQKGIVVPGLNTMEFEVVKVPRHDFTGTGKDAIRKAKVWAMDNIQREHTYHEGKDDSFKYEIDEDAIGKFLSSSSTTESDNLGVHLAVLKKLPEVIDKSIEVEIHPDYKKIDKKRRAENGVDSDKMLVHRMYGAVMIDGKVYRAKTTMHEFRDDTNKPHDYKITEVKLIISGSSTSNALNSLTSVDGAKLLENVEKSYDTGVELLTASEKTPTMFSSVPGSLVAMHNLTASNLDHVVKMGGIANPSMAVVNSDIATLDNFGEITLIAPRDLIEKKSGKNAGTWAADAYTPRYPQVEYVIPYKKERELIKRAEAAGVDSYGAAASIQQIQQSGKRWLNGDKTIRCDLLSNYYFCIGKLRKRSKLLRMNNDLLVEYVLGYELAIYKVFWSSAFCLTSNNSFCIAKVLIFSHFTKNSQRKFPFRPHFG